MLNPKMKQLLKEIARSGEVKTLADIRELLTDATKDVLQEILEAELDNNLGYDRYEHQKEIKDNYRNGHSSKKVKTSNGELEIQIPRDRKGEFEPQIIQKYQRDISDLEQKIISMYSKGMSVRDIESVVKDIYGIHVDSTLVSKVTDRVLPIITEWNSRPLEDVYPIIFIDGIRFKMREENQIVEKSVYIVMGYTMDGMKDVLGFWISGSESSKYWVSVLNELKMRGLKDILVVSCDNLPGISDAIKSVYPKTMIQKCIVHQIRNSLKHIHHLELKEFSSDMKKIYSASSLDQAEKALENFEHKWPKHSQITKSWRNNFEELVTFFNFPLEVRKLIYTTNVIENLNRNIRKISKNKGSFPTENSLLKVVYFAIENQTKKWTTKVRDWGVVYNQLLILFEDRIK